MVECERSYERRFFGRRLSQTDPTKSCSNIQVVCNTVTAPDEWLLGIGLSTNLELF